MSTHMTGFQLVFSFFLHYFVLAKFGSSSIRVKFRELLISQLISKLFVHSSHQKKPTNCAIQLNIEGNQLTHSHSESL